MHPELEDFRAAVPCGRYRGRRFYRVPVRVTVVDTQRLSERTAWVTVIAPSAADAANLVRDEFAKIPCTNITAIGPKGGEVKRFVGWESAIAAELFDRTPRAVQLDLFGVQS